MLPRELEYEGQTGRLNHYDAAVSIYGVGVPINLIHIMTSSFLFSSSNNNSPFRLFFFSQRRQYRSTQKNLLINISVVEEYPSNSPLYLRTCSQMFPSPVHDNFGRAVNVLPRILMSASHIFHL